MIYRVGDGAGVPVIPAGYAWSNVNMAIKDSGIRPTPRGAYVTAAAIYSHVFGRSAKTSGYVPADCSQAVRDELADAECLLRRKWKVRECCEGVRGRSRPQAGLSDATARRPRQRFGTAGGAGREGDRQRHSTCKSTEPYPASAGPTKCL
jgi:hypothetical protein